MTARRRFHGRGRFGAAALVFGALLACKGGKTKAFAAFDTHRLDYGKCELMKESKEDVGGQAPWMAATLCRAKHRKLVVAEVGDKDFDKHFDAWKAEHGAKAVEDARKESSSSTATASGGSGDDCPNGAGCLNRCRSECETKHGKMIDLDKLRECTKGGGGADCVTKASNESARLCFLKCRGLPG
jgi:hypothetical protein